MGINNHLAITNFCDKMEFQGRGAGHIHGVAWSNLKFIGEEKNIGIILSNNIYETNNDVEIKDNDETKDNDATEDMSHLESAYRKLRKNKSLIKAAENVLIDFVVRAVTCTTHSNIRGLYLFQISQISKSAISC